MDNGPQRINDIKTFGNLPARDKQGHKGDFGRVLVVGGSRRMIGAPGLTANGAFRGGAGLVTIASPAPVQLAAAMMCECATSIPLECDTRGGLAGESIRQLKTDSRPTTSRRQGRIPPVRGERNTAGSGGHQGSR